MMVKSGLEFFVLIFCLVAHAKCKKIFPERLNWPGRLAGAEFENKKRWRPLSTIIFSSKMLVSRSEILVHLF